MKNWTRRDILTLAFSTISLPLLGCLQKNKNVGIQLWSVREEFKKDPKKTIETIAKIGYKSVEGFGFMDGKFLDQITPNDFKILLKENDLKMPSIHHMALLKDFTKKTISEEFKKFVEVAKLLDIQYIILPWVMEDERDRGEELVEMLNTLGEYCQQNNLKLGYHNHDFEFKKYGTQEQSLYDILLSKTDPKLVTFEMDLYWTIFANQNPIEWFKKYPSRFELFHVKDKSATPPYQTIEVNQGTIDFQKIFNEHQISGVKHYIIELEHYKTTPLQGIEEAFKGIQKLSF